MRWLTSQLAGNRLRVRRYDLSIVYKGPRHARCFRRGHRETDYSYPMGKMGIEGFENADLRLPS
jgi:hypothetical protein